MKRWIAFLLLLASSLTTELFACGPYYPIGDDIRFVLWKPETFNYAGFLRFSYSADLSYDAKVNERELLQPNVDLWRKRCKNIPGSVDTYQAIYQLGDEINHPEINNSFVRYLHENKDIQALAYLNFAKKCNSSNSVADDPWERYESVYVPKRAQLIREAIQSAHSSSDEDLKIRYAFLAIRLAYYNQDNHQLDEIYRLFFKDRKTKNILDYWGMYFKLMTEKEPVRQNYLAAQVFANAPDKRQSVFFFFDARLPLERSLAFAGSNKEKAALWLISGLKNTGKSIRILKKLYELEPDSPGLSFLLQREVNKLEDWIYTPYYTCFSPSLTPWMEADQSYPSGRLREDRIYAGQLSEFISKANLSLVENPTLWKMAKAWLQYMTEDYRNSLAGIADLERSNLKNSKIIRQLRILKALCINSAGNGSKISDEIKPVLQQEFAAGNNKFLFAIARELEFKGNTTDAAALLSKLKQRTGNIYENGYWRNGIYWRSKAEYATLYVNYYDDYFFYLDAEYSQKQLNDLIVAIKNTTANDSFTSWKFEVLKKELSRLYDLAGTKAIRSHHLEVALLNFRLVSDTLWKSDNYPYQRYLNANPFYTNFYNEHRPSKADTIHYNKAELIAALLDKIKSADNLLNKERDLAYFQVANCYFNMTQYGNSWMMRRYYWTTNLHPTKLEDDDEYFNCKLACSFYLKAMEASRSEKFKALCLRMAGRCEKLRLNSSIPVMQAKQTPSQNKYYLDLKTNYGKYYDDLMSNCETFETFYQSRN